MESSKNDDIAFCVDQALGLFDHHFGDLHVAGGGSSNVELITSPLTERAMSVTSSGRSSISRHDQINFG